MPDENLTPTSAIDNSMNQAPISTLPPAGAPSPVATPFPVRSPMPAATPAGGKSPSSTIKIHSIYIVILIILTTGFGFLHSGTLSSQKQIVAKLKGEIDSEKQKTLFAEKNLETYKIEAEGIIEGLKAEAEKQNVTPMDDDTPKTSNEVSMSGNMNGENPISKKATGGETINIDEIGAKMRDSSRAISLTMIGLALSTQILPEMGALPAEDESGCFNMNSEDSRKYFERGVPTDSDDYHINDGCTEEGKFAYRKIGEKSYALGATMENEENGNSEKSIAEYSVSELMNFEGEKGSGKYFILTRE